VIKFISANGIRFAYLEEGTGPLVLLFHGFPDTPYSWDHVRPLIAQKGYRVVAPFLRGYSPTEIPRRDTDQETLGRDVLALITALGEAKAIIVGHDWGAAAVFNAAALAPARITKLFVLAIPHPARLKLTAAKLWGVRHFAAYKLPGAAGRFAADDFAALPKIYRRWSPAWSPAPEEFAPIRACFADRASLDAAMGYYRKLTPFAPPWLRRPITVPTVAFVGTDDGVVGPADFEYARPMFAADYTVEVMPGGHFLHREHPQIFARKLLPHF
jgi:pimeloyl-ACP methyl ester carboxylesterase